MRGMSAECLVLLLAAGASIVRGFVITTGPHDSENAVVNNFECIFYGNCDVENASDGEDGSCICVPYYLCDHKSNALNRDDECGDALEVCCGQSSLRTPEPDSSETTRGEPQEDFPTPTLGCGQRNEVGVAFHVTGDVDGKAQFGEFPWMVALLERKNGVDKFLGGGSLIHPRVVLTAAHQARRFSKDASKLRVRVGEWDMQTEAEVIKHQQLEVAEVIVHEKYSFRKGLHNDIALLVLREEVERADNVGMICLPEQGATASSSQCIATGWGKDASDRSNRREEILKSIPLPIVPRSSCQSMLRRTKLGSNFTLHGSATCAGGERGKDTCMGDGGGPLACPIPGDEEFYEQGGIVSWGVGCGHSGVPAVYTDVSQFRDWVDAKFNERGLETESYKRHISI